MKRIEIDFTKNQILLMEELSSFIMNELSINLSTDDNKERFIKIVSNYTTKETVINKCYEKVLSLKFVGDDKIIPLDYWAPMLFTKFTPSPTYDNLLKEFSDWILKNTIKITYSEILLSHQQLFPYLFNQFADDPKNKHFFN